MNIIVFDTETGDLDPKIAPIMEIALLAYDVKFKELARYSTHVKPYNNLKINKKALEYTMLSMKDVNNGIEAKKLVDILIKFFKKMNDAGGREQGNPILAGHNVAFDIAFLKELFRLNKKNLADYVASNNGEVMHLDTLPKARLYWNSIKSDEGKKFTLGDCCKRADIQIVDAHGAMNDTIATAKLLQWLTFAAKDSNTKTTSTTTQTTKTRDYFKF